ncbi:MAG: substrate-binding domain-containing protein, partial [Flavisolibacter sp.]
NHSWFKKAISQLTIPVVFNDMRPISALSMVGVDNRSGARKATQHLLEEGYRKIGLLTGPSQWWAGQQRRTGWQDALEETGFSVDPTLIVEGDWSAPSGEQGFYKLLGRRPDIDAIFASNDQMAFGVIRAARRLGRKIPEDLAVVGFDDVPEASFFFPALSTMKQDLFELGSLAVKTLIQILEADDSSETIPAIQPPLLQPELIVRESSTKSTVGKEQYP